MTTAQVAEQVASQPIYLWFATGAGVLTLVVLAVDRTLPKGLAWINQVRAWMAEQRRSTAEARQATEDARLGDQQQQIDGLKQSLSDLRDTVTEQHKRHEEDRREWRRERLVWEAMVGSLAAHTWAWRRAHDAAGRPYSAPGTPTEPQELIEYLAPWDHGTTPHN